MAQTITLENNIDNNSLQIGDHAYYVALTDGYGDTDPVHLGKITAISNNSIEVEPGSANLSATDFIMFSKNKEVNNNSLLGYYAEVKLKNNSTKKAELFALGSEVLESSK
tara:strand:+ start:1747 stop:2076 length:330 start_codon:yes stop_codon:yes gene_type:complete